jgi:hydroxymethylpyrimidine pyrophosphatase-like HAD family hydrolase
MALDYAEEEPVLPLECAERVRAIALEEGARAKFSSIHINIWMGGYDKASMAKRFLTRRYNWNPETGLNQVLYAGDSPNDVPMFETFPLSAAVANISRYTPYLSTFPAFIASKEYGDGFAEIADTILEKRRSLD